MRASNICLVAAAIIAFCLNVRPAAAWLGELINVVDDGSSPKLGALQIAGFQVARWSDKTDDTFCVAYLGTYLFESDEKTLTDIADRAFEEFFGPECRKYAFKSAADGKPYGVVRCVLYLGDLISTVENKAAFKRSLADGTVEETTLRAEYRVKGANPPLVLEPDGGLRIVVPAEFERVSQPEIPVGPSRREPNMTAVPREIAPGQTIGLENASDLTYFGNKKPNFIIYYQSPLPLTDKAANRDLAQKIVWALAADRLKRRELNAVTLAVFKEPKRSRFDFRPSLRFDTDEDGKIKDERD